MRKKKRNADAEIVAKTIGDNIKAVRLMRGFRQKWVAQAATITGPHLSLIENGINEPGMFVLVKLAEVLNVPVAAFFAGIGQPSGFTFPDQTPKICYHVTVSR